MQEVKIYIETSLRGPCIKDGYYAAVLECMTAKGPATKGIAGMERETTYYRTTLLAIVKAMQKIHGPCKIMIYTHCTFVKGMYERGKIDDWMRAEWKKSSGEEVANKELWQQFFAEVDRMGGKEKIEFRFSKYNDYRDLMRKMIEEKKKKAA